MKKLFIGICLLNIFFVGCGKNSDSNPVPRVDEKRNDTATNQHNNPSPSLDNTSANGNNKQSNAGGGEGATDSKALLSVFE
jgi:hypothetical protein